MIEFQRKLLGDSVRNCALFRALQAVIRPGMTVTDIGSGTGFLSFLALRLCAKHCYLYETSEDLLRLSKRIARANGLYRQCTFIHAHSRDIRSPMKTDIMISETLGNFAYEEHIIETMNDARRFLKRGGGILIPQKLRQYVAPVVTDRLWKEINIWDDISRRVMVSVDEPSRRQATVSPFDYAQGDTVSPLDFTPTKEVAFNNMYVKTVRPEDLFWSKDPSPLPSPNGRGNSSNPLSPRERAGVRGTPFTWDSIDFTKKNRSTREGTAHWTMKKATTIYGFAVWWECDLVPKVTLSTSPFETPTHWEQIFLPLLSPIHIKKGGCLSLHITSDSSHRTGLRVAWKVGNQFLSIRKGLICP